MKPPHTRREREIKPLRIGTHNSRAATFTNEKVHQTLEKASYLHSVKLQSMDASDNESDNRVHLVVLVFKSSCKRNRFIWLYLYSKHHIDITAVVL